MIEISDRDHSLEGDDEDQASDGCEEEEVKEAQRRSIPKGNGRAFMEAARYYWGFEVTPNGGLRQVLRKRKKG